MRVAIIGAGIVGLTLAKNLKDKRQDLDIDVFDKHSFPSQGTSVRNSGVLHAGLYYTKDSLKARFCKEGRYELSEFMRVHGLSVLDCGKLLVPHSQKDKQNLRKIYTCAVDNGCDVKIVDYDFAKRIQPEIVPRDEYLWSPKTRVFDPRAVMHSLAMQLVDAGIGSNISKVIDICSEKGLLVTAEGVSRYDFIFNVAGPGSLDLYQRDTGKADRLRLLPVLGQYATIIKGPEIKTNLYPVPDPELPFLGIHITPRTRGSAIIGPNALPILRSSMDGSDRIEWKDFLCRIGVVGGMYASNSDNFRNHANSELCISARKKFLDSAQDMLLKQDSYELDCRMDSNTYGIRPQLVDIDKLQFFNDFICTRQGCALHVVNAVSPAFSSAFAIAKYLSQKFEEVI